MISTRFNQKPFGFFALFYCVVDILALAASIQDLSKASRKARTAMWCSLMVTLLKNFATNESSGTLKNSESQGTQTGADPSNSSPSTSIYLDASNVASDIKDQVEKSSSDNSVSNAK